MQEPGDKEYLAAIACGSLLLGEFVANKEGSRRREKRRSRSKKMSKVLKDKKSAWRAIGEDREPSLNRFGEITREWSLDEHSRLLVDLAFSDPFAPYSLDFDQSDLLDGLRALARELGREETIVDDIESARRSASNAHRGSVVRRMAIAGVAVAVTLGSAGWLAAPAIGAALGSAAGLTGAAATAHGLALLGGGSLAAGGAGMAGGMWLVAGTATTVGLVGGSGSALLFELGAAETRGELVKLQVTFRIAVLGSQADMLKAQQAIQALVEHESELARALQRERGLNDENSTRVEALAEKLDDVIKAREWMEQELAGAI